MGVAALISWLVTAFVGLPGLAALISGLIAATDEFAGQAASIPAHGRLST
jgi:hypothetical protein